MPDVLSHNQYLRTVNGAYTLHIPGILAAGAGIQMNSYNTITNSTINVKFGGTGSGDFAAYSNHTHHFSELSVDGNKIMGRRPGAAGSMEQLTIAPNSLQNNMSNALRIGVNAEIEAKLVNEAAPSLGHHLDAAAKNIYSIRSLVPYDHASPECNLGSNEFR
jgi:hypothetical protein